MQYMTSDFDVEKAPYPDVFAVKGPYVALLHGFPAGNPGPEEFSNFKKKRMDPKTGKEKPLPKSYSGKTTSQVFEQVVKKVFLDWVHDESNGASVAQVRVFL